jgi:hypothetical protein
MAHKERLEYYRKIEELRDRPLIVYVTSTRNMAAGEMANDAIPPFLDQIQTLPNKTKACDLMVVSNGGDPTVAWRIMSLLRERVNTVGVLIPQAAFSAATLLALGADEIVMHACGNLGPVDPQITVQRQVPGSQEKQAFRFGSEDLAGFLSFIKESVGLSDQEHVRAALEWFCKEVGAVPIGVATRGSRLSVSLSEKLLRMHMKNDSEGQKAKVIAETLNTKFFHHGYPLGRKEAKEIGLKVVVPPQELEDIMWRAWLDLETEMECRCPFSPMTEVAKHPMAAKLFGPIQQVNLPGNLPPEIAAQVWQNVLQKIAVDLLPTIDYTVTSSLLESVRLAHLFAGRGRINARRGPDFKVALNVMPISAQWELRQEKVQNEPASDTGPVVPQEPTSADSHG